MYPGSLASKKCQALDVAQQIKKRKHDQVRVALENVKGDTGNGSDSDMSDIRIEDSYIGSPRKDTPIKSTFEETRHLGVTVNVFDTDININSSDQQQITIPEKTLVKPSGFGILSLVRRRSEL